MSLNSLQSSIKEEPKIKSNITKENFNANVSEILDKKPVIESGIRISKEQFQQLSQGVTGGETSLSAIMKTVDPKVDFSKMLERDGEITISKEDRDKFSEKLHDLKPLTFTTKPQNKPEIQTKSIDPRYKQNGNSDAMEEAPVLQIISIKKNQDGDMLRASSDIHTKGDISVVKETDDFEGAKTLYLKSDEVREKYKIDFVKNDKTGKVELFYKDENGKMSPMDTSKGKDLIPNSSEGSFIYVMDKDGKFYSSDMLGEFDRLNQASVNVTEDNAFFAIKAGQEMSLEEFQSKTNPDIIIRNLKAKFIKDAQGNIKVDKDGNKLAIVESENDPMFKKGQTVSEKDVQDYYDQATKQSQSLKYTRKEDVITTENPNIRKISIKESNAFFGIKAGQEMSLEEFQSKTNPDISNIRFDFVRDKQNNVKVDKNGSDLFIVVSENDPRFKKGQIVSREYLDGYPEKVKQESQSLKYEKEVELLTKRENNPDSYDYKVRFHHSTFMGGEAVAGAGTLKIVNGKVQEISDSSGHYKPDAGKTIQVVDNLEKQGVSIESTNIKLKGKQNNEGAVQISAIKLQSHREDDSPEENIRKDLTQKSKVLSEITKPIQEPLKQNILSGDYVGIETSSQIKNNSNHSQQDSSDYVGIETSSQVKNNSNDFQEDVVSPHKQRLKHVETVDKTKSELETGKKFFVKGFDDSKIIPAREQARKLYEEMQKNKKP